MLSVDFDPTRLPEAADPYATLAEVRRVASVAQVAHGFVAVTGYDAANEALRHPGCRSAPIGRFYLDSLPPGAARDELAHRINFLDPPDHPRVRTIVNSAFTPRRVAALRPWMESTIDDLLDPLDRAVRDDPTTSIDLLMQVAHQLPSLVISELLGVPPVDRDRLTELSDLVAPLLGITVSDDDRATAIAGADDFHRYLSVLIDRRHDEPADDLLTALVTAEADGERLSRVELSSLAATLYSAGHRTTRDLFTNGMAALLSQPDHYRAVVDGRWPVPDVIAEILRLATPTLYVARVTDRDITLAGVEVPAGTTVLVFLAAANHDPAMFDEPTELRPGRPGPPALSFAFGAHYCLGASLARSEAEVMLTAVTQRWPELTLAPDHHVEWHLRGPFRGVDRLLVRPGNTLR